MELVQAFNAELSSLYEVKPPISKAKMSQITKVAIKGIKMYKHIVQSVERFIAKCRPEYKIPGLYVIDSIVRQSRHQFGAEKDVFGPRFTRNFNQTFQHLFLTCPQDDKPKIVRVLNLWQRNNVFSSDIIQPLLDMANPNANLGQIKYEGSPTESVNNDLPSGSNKTDSEANLVLSLHQLATTLGLVNNSNNGTNLGVQNAGCPVGDSGSVSQQNTIRFDKKLLDFDYSEDEDDDPKSETPTEAEPPTSAALNNEDANANPLALSMAQNLLSNPELLQRLQQMQQTIQQHQDTNSQVNSGNMRDPSGSSFISSFQPINDTNPVSISHIEMNTSLIDNNNVRNREAMQADKSPLEAIKNYQQSILSSQKAFPRQQDPSSIISSSGNHPPLPHNDEPVPYSSRGGRSSHNYQNENKRGDYDYNGPDRDDAGNGMARTRSRSRSPRRSRFSRSGYRDKDERVKRSRSRSPWRSSNENRRSNYESRSPRNSRRGGGGGGGGNERMSMSPESKDREKEREKERERRRRGLPQIRKGYLTICSTTLWLGHVPKLVSEADISNTFGEFGTINSIDLIPPRGCAYVCMNRRQDANRALIALKNLKLHGSTIKMAWAPGKGMKGKEYKDYWDVELGASYIPYDKLDDNVDIDLLEDGGMIDEDTVPEKLKEIRARRAKDKEERMMQAANAMLVQPATLLTIPGTIPASIPTAVPPVPAAPPPPFGMPLAPGLVSPVVPPVAASIAQPGLPVGIPPPPVAISGTGLPLPSQISSIVTTTATLLTTTSTSGSSLSTPILNPATAVTSERDQGKSNEQLPTSLMMMPNQLGHPTPQSQNLSQILTSTVTTTSSTTSSLANQPMDPKTPLMLPSGPPPVFQGLQLNVPPPSVLSCQRPPPPIPWLTGPPPLLSNPSGLNRLPMPSMRPPLDNSLSSLPPMPTLPNISSLPPLSSTSSSSHQPLGENLTSNENRISSEQNNASSPSSDHERKGDNRDSAQNSVPFMNTNRDPLPPPLHGDELPGLDPSIRSNSGSSDRSRGRFRDRDQSNEKDPFSPPHFELKQTDKPGSGGKNRPPHMPNSPRMPLLGRGSLDNHPPGSSPRERFPFDRRFSREWRMPGPPQPLASPTAATNIIMPPYDETIRAPQLTQPPLVPPHPFASHSGPLTPHPHHPGHHQNFAGRHQPPALSGREWGRRDEWREGRGSNRHDRYGRDGGSGPPGSRGGRFNRNRDRGGGPTGGGRWKSPKRDKSGNRHDRDRERDRDRDRDQNKDTNETGCPPGGENGGESGRRNSSGETHEPESMDICSEEVNKIKDQTSSADINNDNDINVKREENSQPVNVNDESKAEESQVT